MSDLFQDAVPDEYVAAVATVMLHANWHTYQVLTKRADRLETLLKTKLCKAGNAPHIWWGVSVEDKKYGIPRIQHLRQAPVSVRFLSIEPLLEDLGHLDLSGIHWVIVGGESGRGARVMQPSWVKSIKRQCEAQGTIFFFKQWGGVQKAKHGRQLDGRTYDGMPAQLVSPTPGRPVREKLLRDLASLTQQWSPRRFIHLAPTIDSAMAVR